MQFTRLDSSLQCLLLTKYNKANLHMGLFAATVAIFENVPQGQKNVFIPADQTLYKLLGNEKYRKTGDQSFG